MSNLELWKIEERCKAPQLNSLHCFLRKIQRGKDGYIILYTELRKGNYSNWVRGLRLEVGGQSNSECGIKSSRLEAKRFGKAASELVGGELLRSSGGCGVIKTMSKSRIHKRGWTYFREQRFCQRGLGSRKSSLSVATSSSYTRLRIRKVWVCNARCCLHVG